MNKPFARGMVIYALVFLVIAAAGMWLLWDFMDAYEQSRPLNTIKGYLDSISDEDLCQGAEGLIETLDSSLQSREEACAVILASVDHQELSYAKKSGESTEDRQVYVLRCGRQVIGQFAITAGEEDRYGLRVWSVAESSYDFSYLMSQPVQVTVPADFAVCVNGSQLDDGYIVQKDIQYPVLEEFYGDYSLPTLVTYEADAFLGIAELEILDRSGNPVEITEETDMDTLLPACTEEEKTAIDALMDPFLTRYVAFTGSSTGSAGGNYNKLKVYLVENGELADRLATAIGGLYYAQSLRDTITEVTPKQYADLGDGRFFHDISYVVETVGKKGPVSVTYNLKVILLDTEDGLRVEAMTFY